MRKPSNTEFKNIFNGIARDYDTISNSYVCKRRADEILSFNIGEKRILEVGAGTGTVSSFLTDRSRVVLSDISPEMGRVAREKLGCRTVCCDAEELPFADNSFDVIIASEMIHYLNNPEAFIAEAHRVLSPQGFLLISAANHRVAVWYDRIRRILRILGLPRMYFDDKNREFAKLDSLITMLRRHDFIIEKKKRIVFLPFAFCDFINRLFERSFLEHFGLFIIIKAKKI